jgi:hypothetical protein
MWRLSFLHVQGVDHISSCRKEDLNYS